MAYTIHANVIVYDRRERKTREFSVYATAQDLTGFALVELSLGASEIYIEDTNDKRRYCYCRAARYTHIGADSMRRDILATLQPWEG